MNSGKTFGQTIQLFLVDGKPTGLRMATIRGWTGLLFVSGASAFGDLTAREEVNQTGVYVLSGPDPDEPGTTRVYIGSGNSVAKRIEQSAKDRDFWETAIAVTTSSKDLSKGHAEYLEARLIRQSAQANRVTLDNRTQPDADCRLPENEVAYMEHFLSNLQIILPVIGLDMLKPQPRAVTQGNKNAEEPTAEDIYFEIRHKSGVQATAVEEDGEFIVLEGSEALEEPGYALKSYVALKKKMIDEEALVRHEAGRLRFAKPWSFSSPSAAAAVVLDRVSNGRQEWKVKNSTLNYHQWQQKAAQREVSE